MEEPKDEEQTSSTDKQEVKKENPESKENSPPPTPPPPRNKKPVVQPWEGLGKGTKKESSVPTKLCSDPRGIVITEDSQFIILDKGGNKFFILDAEGFEIRHFQYLYNYEFQGGLCLSGDNIILVSLKNEKYSSVSFYKHQEGKFKFSAFVDQTAHIPSIAVNTKNEIVALETKGVDHSLYVINTEKSVSKTTEISRGQFPGLLAHTLAVSTHDDVYILDESNMSVIVYDEHFKHKKTVLLQGRTQRNNTPPKTKPPLAENAVHPEPTAPKEGNDEVTEVKDISGDQGEELSAEKVEGQEPKTTPAPEPQSAPAPEPAPTPNGFTHKYKLIMGRYDTLLLLDKVLNKLELYSCEGKYGYTVLEYHNTATEHLQIQDVCLAGEGLLGVLVTGTGLESSGEIIVYKYGVPGSLRGPKKKKVKEGAHGNSVCCTVL